MLNPPLDSRRHPKSVQLLNQTLNFSTRSIRSSLLNDCKLAVLGLVSRKHILANPSAFAQPTDKCAGFWQLHFVIGSKGRIITLTHRR